MGEREREEGKYYCGANLSIAVLLGVNILTFSALYISSVSLHQIGEMVVHVNGYEW